MSALRALVHAVMLGSMVVGVLVGIALYHLLGG